MFGTAMSKRNDSKRPWPEEIIKAFDREQADARDLSRRLEEEAKAARERDRQVLIERRRQAR